ncbi:hypothetical protein FTO74_06410 [Granulicella sp. WH15]|uniref:hypothetical protein n=1 Tax=Granulicella sp. WH15 TaxID=2602070 RepID=UPI00136697C3|nr:hypothetical protein [Granulicella sp. WH15]QHN03043.1 hypothetical protein FTO74_06410 [Granulicella sp. WH15]
MDLSKLSNETCVAVLAQVGEKYVKNAGYDARTVDKMVDVTVRSEVSKLPDWYSDPTQSIDTTGPLARRLLEEMLDSGDERLATLVQNEIRQAQSQVGKAQIVDLLVGGGFLIALAVISKLKYSKDKGWELEPGFPQLAEVLDKAGKLVEKITGGSTNPA